MNTRSMIAALALAAGACGPVLAQSQDALYIRSLAATCANCHGTDGRAVRGSNVPTIAGMPRDYLITQMRLFKNDERRATVMHQLAKGYTDEQIVQISTYLSQQKPR